MQCILIVFLTITWMKWTACCRLSTWNKLKIIINANSLAVEYICVVVKSEVSSHLFLHVRIKMFLLSCHSDELIVEPLWGDIKRLSGWSTAVNVFSSSTEYTASGKNVVRLLKSLRSLWEELFLWWSMGRCSNLFFLSSTGGIHILLSGGLFVLRGYITGDFSIKPQSSRWQRW